MLLDGQDGFHAVGGFRHQSQVFLCFQQLNHTHPIERLVIGYSYFDCSCGSHWARRPSSDGSPMTIPDWPLRIFGKWCRRWEKLVLSEAPTSRGGVKGNPHEACAHPAEKD